MAEQVQYVCFLPYDIYQFYIRSKVFFESCEVEAALHVNLLITAGHPVQRRAPVMMSLKTPRMTEMPLASAPAAKPASSKIALA